MRLLVIAETVALLAVAQSGPAKQTQPFSITITPLAKEVQAGAEVGLKITLTNTSQQDIIAGSGFRAQGLDPSYQYDCRDASGNPVAKEIPSVGSVHDAPTLKPGGSRLETVMLNRTCNLSQPGLYEIQVSRSDPRDPQHGIIKSNRVAVTITP